MKRTITMIVAALAALVTAGWLQAGEDQPDPKGPPKIFQRLDANHDGQITPDEVPQQASDRLKETLRKADANGDKTLTLQEFAAAARERRGRGDGDAAAPGSPLPPPEAVFRRLDADNDGQLSLEEFKEGFKRFRAMTERRGPGEPGPRGPDIAERLKAADTNHDGKLSKEEAPEPMKQHFEKIDADGDGLLCPDEIKAARQERQKRQAEKPRPEGK